MSIARLPDVVRLIDLALAEDLGRGDVTTEAVIDGGGGPMRAELVAREELVVFGLEVAAAVFTRLDPSIELEAVRGDGAVAGPGEVIAALRGPAAPILRGERTALNFLQRLSGVATLSRRFAEAVSGTGATVVDTRKTTPGYRVLEKAAVRAGGCRNHRADLGSGILIKDNHIAACGSVGEAVSRARARAPHSLRVEVEIECAAQLEEAIAAGAEVVLLDNKSVEEVAAAAARAHEAGLLVEVSGGITLETAPAYARAGADLISSGALTHSAAAVDIALDVAAGDGRR
jgi:nicotinate-nucleotide pyrophosphorylase (carboxylating)